MASKSTHQSNGTEDIGVESASPFLGGRFRDLLHGVQCPMVDNQGIEAAPARVGEFNCPPRDAKVREIPGKNFDFVRAVLVAELVEGADRAGHEHELVRLGEQIMGCCETDALGNVSVDPINVWLGSFCRGYLA